MYATGYLDTRSRHPVALIAALSINLAAVGVMLAYNPAVVGFTPHKEITFKNFPIPPIFLKPIERPKTRQTDQVDRRPRPLVAIPDPLDPPIQIQRPIEWPQLPPQPPIPVGGSDPAAKPAPVEVGAEIDKRYLGELQPVYPAALERAEIEGRVTVRVQVGTDGRVTAVELIRTDDPGFFTATRDQALRRWRFRPATRDGQPVVSWVTKTVVFQVPRN